MCVVIKFNVIITFSWNNIWFFVSFSTQNTNIRKSLIDKTDISKRLKYINIIIKLIDSWLITNGKIWNTNN